MSVTSQSPYMHVLFGKGLVFWRNKFWLIHHGSSSSELYYSDDLITWTKYTQFVTNTQVRGICVTPEGLSGVFISSDVSYIRFFTIDENDNIRTCNTGASKNDATVSDVMLYTGKMFITFTTYSSYYLHDNVATGLGYGTSATDMDDSSCASNDNDTLAIKVARIYNSSYTELLINKINTDMSISWTKVRLTSSYAIAKCFYVNGKFYIPLGNGLTKAYTSSDGLTWTEITTSVGFVSTKSAYLKVGNTIYLQKYPDGVVYTTNGTTYTDITPSYGNHIGRDVTYYDN